ncbi:CBS-domain-containing protein [Coccomyxa subellipsoidea C-169]|uniref:CBS-domain-containing protein n=1 Tax=Coccomyxa subellipsoidea (strain C-169) TaxID=574566 RepID=I0Z141_COCSC|nr:CBS-domain-containing protein [Coccomyxa subellipsoidea C-169]EIE24360.1 CBS-domain-containing protein [Coccomyxa subellipsoidea C-169]|eukprot:XP_005648904.1 CBS-domain-containing protein [Coccomyxa subellipsoidea C-169]
MAFKQIIGTLRCSLPTAARLLSEATATSASKPYPAQICRALATSSTFKQAVADDLGSDSSRVGKQGWGQTKIGQVLQSKHDAGAWLWCSKDDLVIDAVKKMTKGNVGSLLVFDPEKITIDQPIKEASGDAVVGIVTERDYLTKVVVKDQSSKDLAVSQIMTDKSKLMTATPQQSVVDVMKLMTENNFRHVPVVHEGKYLGMVSIRDVVHVVVEEHKEEVGRLHEYIQGSY